MSMKKFVQKLFAFILCCMMLFAVGCAGKTETPQGPSSPPETENPSEPPITENPSGPPAEEKTVDYSTYQSFWMTQADYKTMPICAFNAFGFASAEYYTKDMYSDEYVKMIADAGINVAFSREVANAPEYLQAVKQTLASCEKYGISYMASVSGSKTASNANTLETSIYASLLEDKPAALGGILIFDEPGRKDFEGLKKSIDTFKDVFYQSRYKGLLYHINLFPNFANSGQFFYGDGTQLKEDYTYEQYVDDYLEIVNPSILSYDNYPCLDDKPNLDNNYFANMSFIRKRAMEKGIPFWVYIQSCTWGGRDRVPNQEDNDWQVNTALAYGAKGIQYFCYVTPGYTGESMFANGCLDWNGNKTPTYDIVKETNKQVVAVDEVLMCSKSKGVIVAGTSPVEIPSQDILSSYGALTGVDGTYGLVGCFDYDEQDAYYVVNNNVVEQDEITLTFDGSKSGFYIVDGQKYAFSQKSSLPFTLKAGKAALVVLDK